MKTNLLVALIGTSVAACVSSPLDPPMVLQTGSTPPDENTEEPPSPATTDFPASNSPYLSEPPSLGNPIVAPPETWTYVPFPNAVCGNGKSTGIAVNLSTKSSRALIFLEGGGACWDAATCFALKTATNIETTIGEPAALKGAGAVPFVFDRSNQKNPFRDVSFVYVPYCTGDLHFGTQPRVYDFFGQKKTVHHVGGTNMQEYLARLVPTFATADRVWLMGASAGGFGATLNAQPAQYAFGKANVRVDVIDDGGPMADPVGGRWAMWMKTWSAQFPQGCTGCETSPRNVMLFNSILPGRYALGSYTKDLVISFYFGISADQLDWGTRAMVSKMSINQKAFLKDGVDHVLVTTPNVSSQNVIYADWLTQFVTDDPSWKNVGP